MLAHEGNRVLMLDLDSQCNTTKRLKIQPDESLLEILHPDKVKESDPKKHIKKTSFANLSIIPGSLQSDRLVKNLEGFKPTLLRFVLKRINDNEYEYLIIDCPPNLDHLVQNAIVSSDGVIVPIDDSKDALDGAIEIIRLINELDGKMLGVVLNRINPRTALYFTIVKILHKNWKDIAFENSIRNSVLISESSFSTSIQPVFLKNPNAQVSLDYKNLKREVLERIAHGHQEKID